MLLVLLMYRGIWPLMVPEASGSSDSSVVSRWLASDASGSSYDSRCLASDGS